jgi:hypothetical protein
LTIGGSSGTLRRRSHQGVTEAFDGNSGILNSTREC